MGASIQRLPEIGVDDKAPPGTWQTDQSHLTDGGAPPRCLKRKTPLTIRHIVEDCRKYSNIFSAWVYQDSGQQ